MKRLRTASFLRPRAFLPVAFLAALAYPLFSGGCGSDKACIQWSADRGACPSRSEALATMQLACGPVVAVNSDAVLDEDLCCYDVTETNDFGEIVCGTVTVGPGPIPTGPGVVTVSSGGFPTCAGVLGSGECGSCIEGACCEQLSNCLSSPSCLPCLEETSSCPVEEPAAGLSADAVDSCARVFCHDQCFGGPIWPLATCNVTGGPGTCVTIDPGQGIECNPVTNEGCGFNEACAVNPAGGLSCKFDPHVNSLCSPCGATEWCASGTACVNGFCALFCCDDSECGVDAYCDKQILTKTPTSYGVCMQGEGGSGGAGGGGGAGGSGGGGGSGGAGGN